MRETRKAKAARAQEVVDLLDALMPEAAIELRYESPLELLVAVILSAQCTDKRVNGVTPALFARYPTAKDYAQAKVPELESYIQSLGLYRSKAKNLIAAGKTLVEEHGGGVPLDRASLKNLPGVGQKTAGVVAMHLGGTAAFPVDTHVKRLAKRLGFSSHEDPSKVEDDLQTLLPEALWFKGHQLLVWHGRRTCFARAPACDRCVVAHLCPKIGVTKPKVAKPKRGRSAVRP